MESFPGFRFSPSHGFPTRNGVIRQSPRRDTFNGYASLYQVASAPVAQTMARLPAKDVQESHRRRGEPCVRPPRVRPGPRIYLQPWYLPSRANTRFAPTPAGLALAVLLGTLNRASAPRHVPRGPLAT